MMSPNREDYIKIIFNQNEKQEKLNNKKLASYLNVSPASTSEMVRKLIESGHVDRDKTMGLMLTSKGRKEAEALVQKHRLWEVFLVEHLGYSWTEVHDDAEILEHGTSEKLAKRLNKFLNYPKTCPHGEIIYGNAHDLEDNTQNLTKLKKDQVAEFKRVRDTGELLEYLEAIDFEIGDQFIVKDILPYDGQIIIIKDDHELYITRQAAEDIYVEIIE